MYTENELILEYTLLASHKMTYKLTWRRKDSQWIDSLVPWSISDPSGCQFILCIKSIPLESMYILEISIADLETEYR